MKYAAEKLNYIGLISHIQPDPHSGKDMYILKDSLWGWYEHEIESLYIKPEPIENKWEILDIR